MDTVAAQKTHNQPKTAGSFWKKDWFHYHLMLLPGLVLIFLMSLYPMPGIIIAFKDYNFGLGIWKSPWSGLENFEMVFNNAKSFQVFANTLIIAFSKIMAGQVVPIAFALLLNEVRIRWYKKTVQTIVYLPHFLSWVILAGILRDMFSMNGLFNKMLGAFGVEPIMFLGSNFWFRPILVATDVWKEFGFSAIIYLAALTAISPSLYEAADIDGATRMQKLWYVTLPGIATTVVLLATLSLQNVLNAGFDQVFNLYNTLVLDSGDIIDTYVYRMGLQQMQYEIGTAVGLFKSVVSMILIVTAYKLADKFANYRIF